MKSKLFNSKKINTSVIHSIIGSIGVICVSCLTTQDKILDNNSPVKFRNVVVIVGDDHSVNAVGCYGNRMVRTPSLDSMAAEGVMFTNAYSNAPLCSASRQSILTGKYPHATGVTLLKTPFPDFGNITLAEILVQKGFATGVIGKTHFNQYGSEAPDHGFMYRWGKGASEWWMKNYGREVPDSIEVRQDWKPFEDPASIWLNSAMLPSPWFDGEGYSDVDVKKAAEFMQQNIDQRFFLWIGLQEPHAPFCFPIEYANKYYADSIRLPQASEEDDRWVPRVFQNLTSEEKKGVIASYYTSVEYLDENVGEIVGTIKRLGLADSTLIVYLGDQGYLLGEHKRFEKHTMWEESVKAPLIFLGGNQIEPGRKINQLVEFVDLAPTILDFLDVKKISDFQGLSMYDLINGKTQVHKEYVFAEYLEDNKAMIASKKWKYIYTTGKYDLGQGYETGFGSSGVLHKLYDLENDPLEFRNLASYAEYEEVMVQLQQIMLQKFYDTHPEAEIIPSGLTKEEKLAWFCEAREHRGQK